jgi:hypothetical protein
MPFLTYFYIISNSISLKNAILAHFTSFLPYFPSKMPFLSSKTAIFNSISFKNAIFNLKSPQYSHF